MPHKLWIIVIPTILVALAISYSFIAGFHIWWLSLGFTFLILLSLQAIFIANWQTAAVFIAVEVIALSSFILMAAEGGSVALIVLIALALFILFFYAYYLARHRIKNNLKISLSELRRHALPTMSVALAAFLIANYAVTLIQTDKPLEVSREVIAIAARPLAPVLEKIGTLGLGIGDLESDDSLKFNVTSVTKGAMQYREALIEISHQTINSMLSADTPQQRRSLILTAAVFIFFLATGGLYFVNYVIALLTWLIFKLLLFTGFAKITSETVYREQLVL